MIITLNGDRTEVPDGTSVKGLLERSGHEGQRRGIAIAINGSVVPRGLWIGQQVSDGDIVELLTATQGG